MRETILVPARTISDFYVKIKSSEQKQRFIPQLHLCNGLYLGNAIVSNNNKAYMKIFNTNTQPQRFTIPTVELIDFEELSIHEKTINHNDRKLNLGNEKLNFSQQIFNDLISLIPQTNGYHQSLNISNKNREIAIKELLRLNHLNEQE